MFFLHIDHHYYNPADQFLALPKIGPMCSNAGDRRRPQGLFLSYSLLLARITQLAHHHHHHHHHQHHHYHHYKFIAEKFKRGREIEVEQASVSLTIAQHWTNTTYLKHGTGKHCEVDIAHWINNYLGPLCV